MTSMMRKGLAVAALHVAIVASLGAKLLADRATRPRVWARTAPFDPTLPDSGTIRPSPRDGDSWSRRERGATALEPLVVCLVRGRQPACCDAVTRPFRRHWHCSGPGRRKDCAISQNRCTSSRSTCRIRRGVRRARSCGSR